MPSYRVIRSKHEPEILPATEKTVRLLDAVYIGEQLEAATRSERSNVILGSNGEVSCSYEGADCRRRGSSARIWRLRTVRVVTVLDLWRLTDYGERRLQSCADKTFCAVLTSETDDDNPNHLECHESLASNEDFRTCDSMLKALLKLPYTKRCPSRRPLSPLLFNFLIEGIMRRTLEGFQISDVQIACDENAVDLEYADDIVLVFEE
ncbi:hypothetical protein CLF_104898 [Clonorchis sinensis]|uniref:Reverse transcriptase domain-containing protein n=1 Tax=Clonorchis sinensis TaxID=79923 RepID=G7YCJ3_CLOSI|nr:hypothetical protein CLF_104898 [Clonorchis sinensis]